MARFDTLIANNLQEIHMIGGDEQTFVYSTWDQYGNPLDLTYALCRVVIFKYGYTDYVVATLTGASISGSYNNQFYVNWSGSNLPAGVYQQQVKILDHHGRFHVPAQGKIIVFPSPTTGSYIGTV